MYQVLLWAVGIVAASACVCAIAGMFVRYGYGDDDQDSQDYP